VQRSERRFAAVVVVGIALGCAAPSRHLTNRQVEDPIVHPRGLASVTGGVAYTHASYSGRSLWPSAVLRYGITDRLELQDVSLRYAFLDDAPPVQDGRPDGRRRGPLAVAARAGFDALGYSSLDGFLLQSVASVEARKHLGSRAYVWTDLSWTAWWTSSQRLRPGLYTTNLWPAGNWSQTAVSLGGVIQLVERVALSLGGGAHQLRACVVPSCDLASVGVVAFAGVSVRARQWMDVSLFGSVGGRERRFLLPPPPPDAPVTPPPDSVTWQTVALVLAFRW
jgi:hypothetical protein